MNFVHYKKFVGLHLFMMVLELGMNLKFIWYCTDVFEIAVVENGYWKCDQKIAKYWFIWMFVWFKSWHSRTSVCWICFFWYHQVQYFEFILSAQHCYILHRNAKKTIVTCILTTRHHIQSNMQDRLMQLVQLMQYVKIESFSMVLSNKVLNVSISSNDVRTYQSLGFDTTSFNEEDE